MGHGRDGARVVGTCGCPDVSIQPGEELRELPVDVACRERVRRPGGRIGTDLLRTGGSGGRGREVVDELVDGTFDVGGRNKAVCWDVDVARGMAASRPGEVIGEFSVDLVERGLHRVDGGLKRRPAAADHLDRVALRRR